MKSAQCANYGGKDATLSSKTRHAAAWWIYTEILSWGISRLVNTILTVKPFYVIIALEAPEEAFIYTAERHFEIISKAIGKRPFFEERF